jgi:hypothetical protein
VNNTVAETAGHLTMAGGAAHVSVSRRATAAQLSLLGGAQALSIVRKLSSGHISLTSGTHTVSSAVAAVEVKFYTSDEIPDGLSGSTSGHEPMRLTRQRW